MLSKHGAFVAQYEADIVEAPPNGKADYTFTDDRPVAQAITVDVRPWSAPAWTGSFAAPNPMVRRAVSGLFATPNPTRLCVVERGTAFLVDVQHPASTAIVHTDGPVVDIGQLAEQSCLLLLSPWSITAVGLEGVMWTSQRVAIEDLRIDEADDGWLRGVADPHDEEPRDFAIDLRTGYVVGGHQGL